LNQVGAIQKSFGTISALFHLANELLLIGYFYLNYEELINTIKPTPNRGLPHLHKDNWERKCWIIT